MSFFNDIVKKRLISILFRDEEEKKLKELELTKHITPHANGDPLLKWSSSHSHSSLVQQQLCLLSGLLMETQ